MAGALSPSRAALIGRIGGLTTSALYDAKERTANGRKTFLDSFEKQVDPDGVLPEAERLRRAEAARKAHFSRLALKSADARAARKAGAAT